jgi:hypothetical protein
MNPSPTRPQPTLARFELRFQSLFDEGRGYAFPCDASGHVDLDAFSERLRTNYLYARTLIGRDFRTPAVHPAHLH